MTKDQIISEVCRRLGDQSTGFLTLVGSYFEFAMFELAQRECIGQLRQTREAVIWTASTMSYSTRTVCNLSAPHYPAAISKILVPAWGVSGGYIWKYPEDDFDRLRLSEGYQTEGRPRVWRLYPNETQIQFYPLPDSDAAGETVLVEFLNHPTTLTGSTEITEIQVEDLPTLIALMYDNGLIFNDATRAEATKGALDKEAFIAKMLARKNHAYTMGRRQQMRYNSL